MAFQNVPVDYMLIIKLSSFLRIISSLSLLHPLSNLFCRTFPTHVCLLSWQLAVPFLIRLPSRLRQPQTHLQCRGISQEIAQRNTHCYSQRMIIQPLLILPQLDKLNAIIRPHPLSGQDTDVGLVEHGKSSATKDDLYVHIAFDSSYHVITTYDCPFEMIPSGFAHRWH